VEERGGFVWLFYGSKSMPAEERPPIPSIPELEDPAWRAVYGEIEFECGHWGVFENAIDMVSSVGAEGCGWVVAGVFAWAADGVCCAVTGD
jgi:hypothetical protein